MFESKTDAGVVVIELLLSFQTYLFFFEGLTRGRGKGSVFVINTDFSLWQGDKEG
jgi:hypothetical protein